MKRPHVRRSISFGLLALVGTMAPALAAQEHTMVPAGKPRDAKVLVDEAIAKVAANHKGVLIKFGASWCIPCHTFDKFLTDTNGVGQIMRANFEIVGLVALETQDKLATENPSANEVSKSFGADLTAVGFPFYVILDSTGKKVADSRVMPDGGGIGYPREAEEVVAFDALLAKTAPHMTAVERARIKTYLDRVAGRRAQ